MEHKAFVYNKVEELLSRFSASKILGLPSSSRGIWLTSAADGAGSSGLPDLAGAVTSSTCDPGVLCAD